MSGKVNWEATLLSWKCSDGAQLVTDHLLVKALGEALIFVVNEYSGTVNPTVETLTALQLEKIGKYELIEKVAEQLSEHKKTWETHLEQKGNAVYELPYWSEGSSSLRYFKVIFKNEHALKNFKNIKNVTISYHPAKNTTEVIFYED